MKVFKIKSDYDCLVKVNENKTTLSSDETLEVEDNCKVLVYPIGSKNTLPFSFETDKLTECKFYNFTSLDNDTALICFHGGTLCENYDIVNVSVAGSNLTFEIGENKIVAYYKNWKKIISLDERYNNYITKSKDNIAYIKLTNNNTQTMYAFNVKTGTVKVFSGNNIELASDGFNIEKRGADNTSIKEQYKITTEGLKLENSNHESLTIYSSINETIPFQFLNAMKSGNIDLAYSLCSQSLQNEIDKDSLKDYIGTPSSFYYISPFKYAVQSSNKLTTFKFEVENQKITDVDK